MTCFVSRRMPAYGERNETHGLSERGTTEKGGWKYDRKGLFEENRFPAR